MGWPKTHRAIWNDRNAGQPTSVYGIYDGPDLIYVGMAREPGDRWSQHRTDKPWWTDDLTMVSTEFPTRDEALREESRLIGLHEPRHNRMLPGRLRACV